MGSLCAGVMAGRSFYGCRDMGREEKGKQTTTIRDDVSVSLALTALY